MEFVDNSLDDAEALFDAATGAYTRDVTIAVYVSRVERTLRIVDNCRGMAPDTLSRVVMRVGESRKRGASFVNGQFGFVRRLVSIPRPLGPLPTLPTSADATSSPDVPRHHPMPRHHPSAGDASLPSRVLTAHSNEPLVQRNGGQRGRG